MPGYPDWQRVLRRVSDPIIYVPNHADTTSFSSGILFVGNFRELVVTLRPTSGSVFGITITWFVDAAGTQTVSSTTGTFSAGGSTIKFPLSVEAAYFSVQITAGNPVSGNPWLLSVVPSTNSVAMANLIDPSLIQLDGISIVNGSNLISPAISQIAGPAVLTYSTISTASVLSLQFQTADAVWHQMLRRSFSTAINDNLEVILPFRPIRTQIFNTGPSTQMFWCNLSAKLSNGS